MDSANDTVLKRFSSFWLGALLFGAFGLLGILVGFWYNKPKEDSFDAVNAARRGKIKQEVREAQAGAPPGAAAASFEKVGATFLSTEPAAVKEAAFLLQGSETAKAKVAEEGTGNRGPGRLSAGRGWDSRRFPPSWRRARPPISPAWPATDRTARGFPISVLPSTGRNGCSARSRTSLRSSSAALTGEIEVKGTKYKPVAPMPPQAFQDDNTIAAAVLTYIRNSFGNAATPVLPEQVAALRGETGKPMLTQADLIPPK